MSKDLSRRRPGAPLRPRASVDATGAGRHLPNRAIAEDVDIPAATRSPDSVPPVVLDRHLSTVDDVGATGVGRHRDGRYGDDAIRRRNAGRDPDLGSGSLRLGRRWSHHPARFAGCAPAFATRPGHARPHRSSPRALSIPDGTTGADGTTGVCSCPDESVAPATCTMMPPMVVVGLAAVSARSSRLTCGRPSPRPRSVERVPVKGLSSHRGSAQHADHTPSCEVRRRPRPRRVPPVTPTPTGTPPQGGHGGRLPERPNPRPWRGALPVSTRTPGRSARDGRRQRCPISATRTCVRS
jgi:hypothetical protein